MALTEDNRVIATAYNGLPSGQDRPPEWWANDENRRANVVHAEMNLCSLIRRNQAHIVAVTTAPCSSCAKVLAAHGVEVVYFSEHYRTDPSGLSVLDELGVDACHVPWDKIHDNFIVVSNRLRGAIQP